MNDKFMTECIALAKKAASLGEVPVGAVVVKDGKIIGEGYNLRETNHSPTAHAEIMAIEAAAKAIGDWRLDGCSLYVTLEPCPMCAGAIINSRVDEVIFGAFDLKGGAVSSKVNLFNKGFNHKPIVYEGIYEKDCANLLTEFFKTKR